ncbi:phage tail tube protein [Bifidobacterium myosotis]|uniref:phage tail tube protein n=1 Tax=Bifidobacterium myosotis TaxID=1630166 RepID=UPI00168A9563|nr:Ig-like domain-containing protein [Bifidobacterium myosotis]
MAINEEGIIQSVRGAIFESAADAPLPKDGVSAFRLDVESIDDGAWVNVGHTSNDNLPEFSLDGGDATTLSTWLKSGVRTTYAETTGTVTWNSVQGDTETLKNTYNGVDVPGGGVAFSLDKREQKKGLFILWEDTNSGERMGMWLPNVSKTFNSFPALSNDAFVEYGLIASILSSDVLPKYNGKANSVALFGPELFSDESDTKPVESVAVTPETVNVNVGDDVELTVAFTPADADDQTYTVASSDDATATASIKAGSPLTVVVHGVKENADPVTITITTNDGAKTASAQVTVAPKA